VAFRLATVDPQMLVELITDGWYSQAPRYLRKEYEGR
jgi:hypothetical protein